jgi:hypothetical protein
MAKNPGDTTGIQAERNAARAKAEREAQAAERERITTLASLTESDDPVIDAEPVDLTSEIIVDEVSLAGEISVEEASTIIRVNDDLPSVTIGAGNIYSFERGKRYRVPKYVAEHLDEKGYVHGGRMLD